MTEGPLGFPRPLAQESLNGQAIFTNPITGGPRVTIPQWFRDERDIQAGDDLNVAVYPLEAGILNVQVFREFRTEVTNRNRITIPSDIARELHISEGKGVMVAVMEASN